MLELTNISSVNLRKRIKTTPKRVESITYQLEFYSENASNILKLLYGSLQENDLKLERKYQKSLDARNAYERVKRAKLIGRKLEKHEILLNKKIDVLIRKYVEDGLIPRQIAEKLEVSLSTLYRVMDSLKIQKMDRRGSKEWTRRLLKSKGLLKQNG